MLILPCSVQAGPAAPGYVSFTAATTGVTYAVVGDLGAGAQFNFPDGDEIDFIFDEVTDAASNMIRVYGSEYVAIDVVAPDAFVKIVK